MAEKSKKAAPAVSEERRMEQIFGKAAGLQIRVYRQLYKGRDGVSVRTFYEEAKDDWRPNQKGVTMNSEELTFGVGFAILAACFEKDPEIRAFLDEAQMMLAAGVTPQLVGS